jgi:hypothetical protein
MAVITNTIAPELTADINGLVASLLPRRGGIGRAAAKGSESESSWSPSVLTTLNERAALKNNEVQSLNS